eukprot:CAMPEP_0173391604 /NCGR_PEP_ID=MMETSP1356-20130122/18482_1 /TAXON_ID=77927 ORGANISM="Hemiselmis virescens, Strain PCC157" /NCGR_SAMPLE_ID=MMETSP1356 /ASSEMBLY_ACC=CAM_ASM_000847 /LENGTH=130 /DNA_ID=CAMNT_0014349261 /DNA_START=237 /DNA_END=626 /DNA_ORIENTATION=+
MAPIDPWEANVAVMVQPIVDVLPHVLLPVVAGVLRHRQRRSQPVVPPQQALLDARLLQKRVPSPVDVVAQDPSSDPGVLIQAGLVWPLEQLNAALPSACRQRLLPVVVRRRTPEHHRRREEAEAASEHSA